MAVRDLSINLINTVLENDVLNIGPGFLRIKLVETFSEIVPEVTIPQKLNLVIRPGDIKKHPAEEIEAFKAQIYSLKPGYISTTNHKQNYPVPPKVKAPRRRKKSLIRRNYKRLCGD